MEHQKRGARTKNNQRVEQTPPDNTLIPCSICGTLTSPSKQIYRGVACDTRCDSCEELTRSERRRIHRYIVGKMSYFDCAKNMLKTLRIKVPEHRTNVTLTEDDVRNMLELQNGVCALSGEIILCPPTSDKNVGIEDWRQHLSKEDLPYSVEIIRITRDKKWARGTVMLVCYAMALLYRMAGNRPYKLKQICRNIENTRITVITADTLAIYAHDKQAERRRDVIKKLRAGEL